MARASYYRNEAYQANSRGNGDRRNGDRRTVQYGYIDGNTVRKPRRNVNPVPERQTRANAPLERNMDVSRRRRNRARALQMNVGYVAFLTAASIATLFVCVNYLQLQAKNTTYRNQVAAAESTLNDMRLENDTEYENALASVDLETIRDIAVNKLGMVYADEGQVKTYDNKNEDYVRQYEDVPEE